VRFHDGAPLTAEDVVFSLDRARGEGSEAENELGFGERVIAMPWARAWLRARPSILRVCFRRV
jgi:ABC-type transport system substrate-binding protein